MLASIALFGLVLSNSLQDAPPKNFFVRGNIGAAVAAIEAPESVTVRSVYPAAAGTSGEHKIGIMAVRFVGKPHDVKPNQIRALLENLQNPVSIAEPTCVFHPDHLITLKAKGHTIQMYTCFTCDELMIDVDGKFHGRKPMGPPKKLRQILTNTVPLTDTLQAAVEEYYSKELRDWLILSPQLQVSELDPNVAADARSIQDIKPIGAPKALPSTFANELLQSIEVFAYNTRLTFKSVTTLPVKPNSAFWISPIKPDGDAVADGLVVIGFARGLLFRDGRAFRTVSFAGMEQRLEFLITR